MPDFTELKRNAKKTQHISGQVIDNFLIYYAAEKDGLDKQFESRIKKYRHITGKMPKEWRNFLKSQYVAHQIFKSGGHIAKYLNHVKVGYRSNRELKFLELQKEHPWRYCFSEIIDNPHSDFYKMRDLFTGQFFLLYSPSITKTLLDIQGVRTWFNLISYDGKCAQTYGTVAYFRGFDREDITFFARELDHNLETDAQIAEHINTNPLPYAMLWSGAMIKQIAHEGHLIRNIAARYYDDDFRSNMLDPRFKKEYADNVYRLPLKEWDSYPHYAKAYYDEIEEILHLTAMTHQGFEMLVDALNNSGYDLPHAAHDDVSPGMLYTASDILNREIKINPFETLFDPGDDTDIDNEKLDAINHFMELLSEVINSGDKPDIKKMADKVGLDLESAATITKNILDRLDNRTKD